MKAWELTRWCVGFTVLFFAFIFILNGLNEPSLRINIRWSARFAAIYFSFAFMASSLQYFIIIIQFLINQRLLTTFGRILDNDLDWVPENHLNGQGSTRKKRNKPSSSRISQTKSKTNKKQIIATQSDERMAVALNLLKKRLCRKHSKSSWVWFVQSRRVKCLMLLLKSLRLLRL